MQSKLQFDPTNLSIINGSHTHHKQNANDPMPDLFPVDRREMFSSELSSRLTCDTDVHLCATTITISAAILRTQFRARILDFSFHPVIGAARKNTRPVAARDPIRERRDGLPFRFERFHLECLGHFQSKPKPNCWMGTESRPQRRATANANVTQTRQERVRPAPRSYRGSF